MNIRALCFALLLPMSAVAESPVQAQAVPERRIRLALTLTSAFGVSNAGFFNQLVGPRFDYLFTTRFALGGTLAYANLKGKEGRAHNALPEAMLEYRAPITGESFGMPLRFAGGFLLKNGPTLRVSAGLDFAFSEGFSVELIPIEPMVWVSRERPEVSLNASLALRLAP